MILSVILPVYNGDAYLYDAIDSILKQTFKDFELIIINDGSTDRSLEICREFNDVRVIIIDQENKGLAKTLNVGLNKAKGKYIARMDADDIALPNRFEEQLNYLKSNPSVGLLGTAVDLIDKEGNSICIDVPYTGNKFLKKFLLKVGNPFKHPTVIFDRELALKLGGYNETIGKYFEDYFLWNEIADHAKVEILSKVLLKYRITPGSIMSSVKSNEFSEFMLKVINKRSFDHRDYSRMVDIKERESEKNGTIDKDSMYQKRILSTKNNRMNRLFISLQKNTNTSIAFLCIGVVKKIRIYPKLF